MSTDHSTPYIVSLILQFPQSPSMNTPESRNTLLSYLTASLRNKNLEAYNIVVGCSTQPFLSFGPGEWLLCLQVIAEPVSGLDLDQYLNDWQEQTYRVMWKTVLDVFEGPTRESLPIRHFCREAQRLYIHGLEGRVSMDKVFGVEDNLHCIRSMRSWTCRTEVAVVEDVPFLMVKDGHKQLDYNKALKISASLYDGETSVREMKADVAELRDEKRWDVLKERLLLVLYVF